MHVLSRLDFDVFKATVWAVFRVFFGYLMPGNVVVQFWFIHLLPASGAKTELNISGRFTPARGHVPMLVAILWLGENKPIFDFSQNIGRFHSYSGKGDREF